MYDLLRPSPWCDTLAVDCFVNTCVADLPSVAHQRADYERPPYKVASPHPSLRDTFPRGEGFKTVNCRRCHFDRSEGFNPNAAEKSPAVGEPPPASGLARVRKRHFVSRRLPRRYAPRNDKAVRNLLSLPPRGARRGGVKHRKTSPQVTVFTVSIFTFPQKKKPSGERRLLLFVI